MPFLDGPVARAYYRRWSAGSPRAQVLLLHGFGEHTGHYHRLAAALTDAGAEVWGIDHIGHGHTGGTAGMFGSVHDLAANASALLQLMTHAAPELPVVIVGHSLGALTGALVALGNPDSVRGLVMTGAPLWGLPPAAAGRTDLIMATDAAYLDALEHDPLGFDTAAAEPNLWRALSEAGSAVRLGLQETDIPVLLINGEHDVFAAPEDAAQFADRLPRGHAVCIAGGYHDIPNDAAHRRVAALINQAVAQWSTAAVA